MQGGARERGGVRRRLGQTLGEEKTGSEDEVRLRGSGTDHETKAGGFRGPGRRAEVTELGPDRDDTVGLSEEGGAKVWGELKNTGWRVSAGRVSQRGHTRIYRGGRSTCGVEAMGGEVKGEAQEGPCRLSLRAGVEENWNEERQPGLRRSRLNQEGSDCPLGRPGR
jgi:hypothetical protein